MLTGLVLAAGGSAGEVRSRVDVSGCTIIDNPGFSTGCGSSVSAAIGRVRGDAVVLLPGDQPGVSPAAVRRVAAVPTPLGACRYDDGLGHPFLFRRPLLAELAGLHGDKAVWKVLHSGRHPVTDVPVPGPVPIDVDTRDDYERLLSGG